MTAAPKGNKPGKVAPSSDLARHCPTAFSLSDESRELYWPEVQMCEEDDAMVCRHHPGVPATMCRVTSLALDTRKVKVSTGAENLYDVAGREESDEYPEYTAGAWEARACSKFSEKAPLVPMLNHLEHMIMPSKLVVGESSGPCDATETRPTLLVQRYEYCNLFHTMTDWYNTYLALEMFDVHSREEVVIVWLDGHAAGNLDEPWTDIFAPAQVLYLSQLPRGPPAPNTTPLAANPIVVTILVRKDYVAHPRNLGGSAERKLVNCNELAATLNARSGFHASCYVFTELTYGEQLRIVAASHILTGIHGAGLSHVLFMSNDVPTGLLEIVPVAYRRRHHYQNFCRWADRVCQVLSIPRATRRHEYAVDVDKFVNAITDMATRLRGLAGTRANAPADSAVTEWIEPVSAYPPSPEPPALLDTQLTLARVAAAAADTDASAEPLLCVLVPFRDSPSLSTQGAGREANLDEFVPYMEEWLTDAGRRFKIIVAEQDQGGFFNKGAMFNAAFVLGVNKFGCEYVVLHDVDQLPTHMTNNYGWRAEPTHLCAATTQDGFTSYSAMVGGALQMRAEDYVSVGGFSNGYWGWGREDDDMYLRITHKFGRTGLKRLSRTEGHYRALPHPRVMGLDATKQFSASGDLLQRMRRHEIDVTKDGVQSLKAELLAQTVTLPNYARFVIRIHSRDNLVEDAADAVAKVKELVGESATPAPTPAPTPQPTPRRKPPALLPNGSPRPETAGLHLAALDVSDGAVKVLFHTVFDTSVDKDAADTARDAVSRLDNGVVLALAVAGDAAAKLRTTNRLFIQNVFGGRHLTEIGVRSSYCAISKVGAFAPLSEQLTPAGQGGAGCAAQLAGMTIEANSFGGDDGSLAWVSWRKADL
ncbi:xylosyltransferase 2 [Thecamonas trahens ATCC 50062]|uniref:Xylosyltransferase 2 n=1 Tax=Thecamonas trahens ATCC 50062 TaxID=461836 RepID=A0A0L0DAT1_THETB|nr:xylosyltransferase 2 [Thecamonas trahens ATCC 50062]KNC49447.1 xylosyltransferase 2 [Thecamonas trahens ATCC 50062]|eukprot:XP_013757868.1 xylosyltransferase 2 [Thecamonas trahens ATCC 50062]